MPLDFAFQVSSFSVITATETGEFEKLHVGKMSCIEEINDSNPPQTPLQPVDLKTGALHPQSCEHG